MTLALRLRSLRDHHLPTVGRIRRAPTPKRHPDVRDGDRTHWQRRRDLARWAERRAAMWGVL
jgi:hypothetical protein